MMTFDQIVNFAIQHGLSQEKAENLAMSMHLQGITQIELVESAIKIQLNKN